MGELMVPAGMEEEWIRHLLDIAGDPNAVTTSHGPIGLVFYAPDDVIEQFNMRLSEGQPAPEWGNGEPVRRTTAEPVQADEVPETTEPPKRRGRPPGSKTKTNADIKES